MAARKSTKRPGAKAPERTSINITLPVDLEIKLGHFAIDRRTNKSAIIAEALEPLLKGCFFTRRTNGASPLEPDAQPREQLQSA